MAPGRQQTQPRSLFPPHCAPGPAAAPGPGPSVPPVSAASTPVRSRAGRKGAVGTGCFMWIQELNLALPCVCCPGSPGSRREMQPEPLPAPLSERWAILLPGQALGMGCLRSFQFASRLCTALDWETGVGPRLCPPSLGFPQALGCPEDLGK